MADFDRQQKARIGKMVAQIAKMGDFALPAAQLSNWRQGWCLPRLELFLSLCESAGIRDLTPFFTAEAGEIKPSKEKCSARKKSAKR